MSVLDRIECEENGYSYSSVSAIISIQLETVNVLMTR
jgi:hypothetical protein